MKNSDRYHLAACELIISFLEEFNLLTDDVRNMIFNKDIDGLLGWSRTLQIDAVKVPLDVFIGGLQLSNNLQRLQVMVEDLRNRAENLQARLNNTNQQGAGEIDWTNVEGWH